MLKSRISDKKYRIAKMCIYQPYLLYYADSQYYKCKLNVYFCLNYDHCQVE